MPVYMYTEFFSWFQTAGVNNVDKVVYDRFAYTGEN